MSRIETTESRDETMSELAKARERVEELERAIREPGWEHAAAYKHEADKALWREAPPLDARGVDPYGMDGYVG